MVSVAVLLATYNGRPWLPDQLTSILAQQRVRVEVLVSDDGSTDGTWEWLQEASAADSRVRLLPRGTPSGSAAGNFYRLVRDAPWRSCDFVAFADQDDFWLPDKLSSQVAQLKSTGSDGVSSNVWAFWPDGRRVLIAKAQPQRSFDFLFEGPGPGCTFLMTPWLVSRLYDLLAEAGPAATGVEYHDWLVYAVCRAAGRRWHLGAEPTLLYRQHLANAIGANVGPLQALRRLRQLGNHWHRGECTKIGELALLVAPPGERERLEPIVAAIRNPRARARLALLRRCSGLRRRWRDRVVLTTLIAIGVW